MNEILQFTPLEQALMRRLSIFVEGFSREAIAAVAAVAIEDDASPQVTEHGLGHLIAQGVVMADTYDNEMRYHLPDMLRATAYAQLIASGEADVVYRLVLTFYMKLAEQVLDAAFGPQRGVWMSRLLREHSNLRAILAWLIDCGDAERGLQLVFLLQELWFENAHTSEGRTWFRSLLALPQAAARTTLRAQSLDLAGALALHQGDYVVARALKEEGLDILRETGDTARIGYALLHLGYVVGYAQGDPRGAQALYQEGLDCFRKLANADGIAHALANLGTVAILLGDYAAARPLVADSLRMYRELGYAHDVARSLNRAAGIAAGTNQPERALRLAGASARHYAQMGVSQPRIFQEMHERMILRARQTLNEAIQAALWVEGQGMSLEQAITYALDELTQSAPDI